MPGQHIDAHALTTRVALFVMPLALVAVGVGYFSQIFPVFSGPVGYDQDPAYVYLLNGLGLLKWQVPSHYDHPGTPLQVLIAIVVGLRWTLSWIANGFSGPGVVDGVTADPEAYLAVISAVLLALNAGADYYFGRQVWRTTGSAGQAVFAQGAPLAFWMVAPRLVYASPEALLIAVSLLLLGVLMPLIVRAPAQQAQADPVPRRIATWAGVLCGVGVATKVTFVPLLCLLFMLPSVALIRRALAWAGLALLICILPIAKRLWQMVTWFADLIFHSGAYGSGAATVMDPQVVQRGARMLTDTFPFFFAVVGAMALVLVWRFGKWLARRKRASCGVSMPAGVGPAGMAHDPAAPHAGLRAGAAIVAACIVQTAFVLKHPGPHYMIPALPLSFVGVVWLAFCAPVLWRTRAARVATAALLPVLGIALTADATQRADAMLRSERTPRDEAVAALTAELARHPDALVIGTYRCVLPACSLAFGAGYAPGLDKQVAPAFQNFVVYNIWNRKLLVFGSGWEEPALIEKELARGREVLLLSPDYDQLVVFERDPIQRSRLQTLYRVRGLAPAR